MAAEFHFEHRVEFTPETAIEVLRPIVAGPGVFALRGESGEPYLTRAADVRRRLKRLLAPPETTFAADGSEQVVASKRLNLRNRVRFIEWTATGSEFESTLLLYCATRATFGEEQARKRLRLYAPAFLRVTLAHEHPRVYVTNKLSAKALATTFGPFPSRAAAERYCDGVLDLFKLRRCHEDLQVHPDHPGCAYGEMKKCMEPCKAACTADEYAAEAEAVRAFFATRGESMLAEIAKERDAASEDMDFERAAELHAKYERVKAAAIQADELVRPVNMLRVLVLQQAASEGADASHEQAAVFLLEHGEIVGPQRLSTLGVRAVREQTAVGSSLFAQPLMLAAVPLVEEGPGPKAQGLEGEAVVSLSPEERVRALLAKLEGEANAEVSIAVMCDFLALFRRWYYRPEKQRAGEVFLPNADGSWPVRRILNGAARVVLGPPKEAAPVDREAAAAMKTKVLHEGREDVERVVPVLPKRKRTRKATDAPQP
ncbi:excinuclease ABC subunit C [Granulicella cerasi]|uniref:Excinuclease ABC subunit C n=1 Tax=Granulicella cerasi TaxID=741063 RepID=A0ABW1Z8K7_9BACT|nr:excinuclease ABC subunit C [Granulicella cerasi]